MCGIAGFIDPSLKNKEQADALLENMLETIAYRGPDARGKWIEMPVALGHNRLSIIDLSEGGKQPMHFEDYVITFNGEIYNYIEVREELIKKGYQFKSSSDTEVILAAYKEYGESCVNHFIGMWAMVIYTKSSGKLFASRDRFGIKPLYYIQSGDKFYFGSEYKPLKVAPVFSNELNLNQINRGLQLGWITYNDETYFEKIKVLPEGCNLNFLNGKVNVYKYWDIDLNIKSPLSFVEKKTRFSELFSESIKLHNRSDVEVGECLSGGLDSSSIACAINKIFPETPFKTFTVYYEGMDAVDERPWVNEVLKQCKNITPYYASPTDDEIASEFKNIVHHADIPIAGSSPISQYFVMKLAGSKKIKVILDGQGSDEYLAGYMHSFYRQIGGLIRNLNVINALGVLSEHKRQQGFSMTKSADIFAKSILAGMKSEEDLYRMEYKHYFPFLPLNDGDTVSLNTKSGSRLNNFLYQLMFHTSLPHLLHYEDRNSMAFSIESRVPFLDHRLVEFAFSLNDFDKINHGETKYILRKSLSNLLPEKIANRKDKKGFVTPGEVKWLRGPLKFLLDGNFTNLSMLNQQKLNAVINKYKAGDNSQAVFVWRICMLNYWLNQ
ncbi:MAG: asparagine synthase (glutamine-hydrolyzing) [Bacteroidota bacterium]